MRSVKFPVVRKPYRLWQQAETFGFYRIKPDGKLSIWHLADGSDCAGFWPMVATKDSWEAMTCEPASTFEIARSIICSYCVLHGLEEAT
jgi:hypothetical protein